MLEEGVSVTTLPAIRPSKAAEIEPQASIKLIITHLGYSLNQPFHAPQTEGCTVPHTKGRAACTMPYTYARIEFLTHACTMPYTLARCPCMMLYTPPPLP